MLYYVKDSLSRHEPRISDKRRYKFNFDFDFLIHQLHNKHISCELPQQWKRGDDIVQVRPTRCLSVCLQMELCCGRQLQA